MKTLRAHMLTWSECAVDRPSEGDAVLLKVYTPGAAHHHYIGVRVNEVLSDGHYTVRYTIGKHKTKIVERVHLDALLPAV